MDYIDRSFTQEEVLSLFGLKQWCALQRNMDRFKFNFLRVVSDENYRWVWKVSHPSTPKLELQHESPTALELLQRFPSTHSRHTPNREIVNATECQETGIMEED